MMENNFKERIVENLKRHPEGLTILDIAEKTGINRVTVSKYVLVLMAEGLMTQRKIGTAKLCYLKIR
jgi:DNA-binding IclR family transcriptional regulator